MNFEQLITQFGRKTEPWDQGWKNQAGFTSLVIDVFALENIASVMTLDSDYYNYVSVLLFTQFRDSIPQFFDNLSKFIFRFLSFSP